MADQVTLNQMLGALDKDIASQVGKKLKKLSKRKQLKAPDDLQLAKIQRKAAYSETSKDVTKWEPLIKQNRKSKLSFPLDRQQNVLESSVEACFQPRNELEAEIHQQLLGDNNLPEGKGQKLTAKERRYLKSISAEEAKERLKDMQKTRVLLNTLGAKMKRQKKIKSKSYRRLLKQERIKNHIKNVESNEDKLMDEIERLHKIRAQERATLRHKNTGKWAKHAKFRAKYDEEARQALVEQIGVAGKLLDRAEVPQSDSEEESEVDDEEASSDSDESEAGEEPAPGGTEQTRNDATAKGTDCNDRLIVSSELIDERSRKRKISGSDADDNDGSDGDDGEGDEEDEQRKLMSEAFANDDVVGEFKSLKNKLADEEQPKDLNLFLPGWGDWAGPGIKVNRRKKKKFIIKAKRVDRKDKSLSNVIISEKANGELKELQVRKLPRGVKNENHLEKILTRPVVATFVNQKTHREATRPRIETKLGARIEPLSESLVKDTGEGYKAKWV